MIHQVVSFGLVMLIVNTVTVTLLCDLIYRVSLKLYKIRHPHLYWSNGMIFLAFLLAVVIINGLETYMCYVNYIQNAKPMATETVAFRVFIRVFTMLSKIFLWYYTVIGDFSLFRDKK